MQDSTVLLQTLRPWNEHPRPYLETLTYFENDRISQRTKRLVRDNAYYCLNSHYFFALILVFTVYDIFASGTTPWTLKIIAFVCSTIRPRSLYTDLFKNWMTLTYKFCKFVICDNNKKYFVILCCSALSLTISLHNCTKVAWASTLCYKACKYIICLKAFEKYNSSVTGATAPLRCQASMMAKHYEFLPSESMSLLIWNWCQYWITISSLRQNHLTFFVKRFETLGLDWRALRISGASVASENNA